MCATSRIIIIRNCLHNPHLNANYEQCSNAAMLATTHGTHVHEIGSTCEIEKHPLVCWESFWGHPLGTITTDGPPKFGPILKSIQPKNNEHSTPIFQ
jgi:hypothetical protein